MTQPEPELRRVEPTGDPRVDALIDAMVCPSCRTIYNAAKAKCADPWHSDNRYTDCHLAGMHPADCPAYVAGIATLRERLTTAPIRLTRSAAEERDSLARRLSVRFAEAEELRAQLAQLRAERDAAYERGVAEGRRQTAAEVERICNAQHDAYEAGRRQATEGIEDLRRPFFHTEAENGVTLAVTYQGADGLAFVAQPRRPASEPYEQYGVVLPRDVARTLALRMLASVGTWEPAEQDGDGAR